MPSLSRRAQTIALSSEPGARATGGEPRAGAWGSVSAHGCASSHFKDRETGKAYWRSLEELDDTAEFRAFVEAEFPSVAPEMLSGPTRRQFLKLMGASAALAGLTGCRWPQEKIAPYAHQPEGRVPGVPVQYATAMELGGAAQGLLVTSYDGRPIKVEGNPLHPTNQGSSDAFAQASILELYDPDRSRVIRQRESNGTITRTWDEFAVFVRGHFGALRERGGAGLCILSERSSSPSLADMRQRFLGAFPQAQWYEYEPVSRDNERVGATLAFGKPYRTHLHVDRADVIVALDDDFLMTHPAATRYARDFAAGRQVEASGRRVDRGGPMNRLYVFESAYSVTGGMADHRFRVRSSEIAAIAVRLAAELRGRGLPLAAAVEGIGPVAGAPGSVRGAGHVDAPEDTLSLGRIADELLEHRGRCVITAGPQQPPEVHALVHTLNITLGNVGQTISYTIAPDADRPTHAEAIAELVAQRGGGQVDTLVMLGGNPAFDAPADLEFAKRLAAVKTSVHLNLYRNETANLCTWHLPRAHALESWGDERAYDGTVSIVQPLIEPLYGGKTPIEVLALILGEEPTTGYDIVRRTMRSPSVAPPGLSLPSGSSPRASALGYPLPPLTLDTSCQGLAGLGVADAPTRETDEGKGGPWDGMWGEEFERSWRQALHDGIVADSAFAGVTPLLRGGEWIDLLRAGAVAPTAPKDALEVVFRQDHRVYDGRFANNGWLQELPDPMTKITWDNPALLAPATAERLGISTGDVIKLTLDGRVLEIAAFVMPGHAPDSITLRLGYGRTAAGRVGNGVGFNTYGLRTTKAMDLATGAQISKTGGRYKLAVTQDHHAIQSEVGEREKAARLGALVREASVEHYREHPDFAKHAVHHPPLLQLWEEPRHEEGHRWALAIDLNICTGCSACVAACQAENNSPVVGKDEVDRGREMHWIRVDRYFRGEPDRPEVVHQPLTCHHCENAPCEQVCPVAATMHSQEGLNEMVYNRCIGTRYCSNNCPYKVRRFNWFNNHKNLTEVEKLAFNPAVTVRSRGVMEKCTYCVQRINAVKIAAKNERRSIRDGEITPACAQACPTQAIVFGDLSDKNSRVAQWQASERAYAMLAELNVRPRTQYLAKLRNPAGERPT